MASISRQPNGHKTIQFADGNGTRKSIRLGKVPLSTAKAVRVKVEHLVAASITGHALDDETARWVAGLDSTLADRLAAVGLIPKRAAATLASFIDGYIASRGDVKPSTATVYGHTRRCLVEHFGESKPLRDITPGDADDWRRWLVTDQKLADNIVRRRCGIAKQLFRVALRKFLIRSNPFAELVSATHGNPKRLYFVTREDTAKVLEACPNAEWRLLFALSRYGGLRCPSEHLRLRWSDIDWERGRFTVHSPKTEHHVGGDSRVVPIFPELLPYLRESFELATDGAEYAITCYRNTSTNLRTQLTRIIKRAGLTPWPKLWQNLRSTRQTELEECYPSHVVCSWIGNSESVAAEHYLQVTDDHFERAASESSAVQKAVQNTRASQRTAVNGESAEAAKPLEYKCVRDDASSSNAPEVVGMGPVGLEPTTNGL